MLLRGSEASKAIGEDFMETVAQTVEDTVEHKMGSNEELTKVLSAAGVKTIEAMVLQASIAGATMAGKAIMRSCQRRRPGGIGQHGDKDQIAEECKELKEAIKKFGVNNATCIHRIGTLEIGDTAVIVIVNSGHRDESFKACRYIIDEVKIRVPIWKKEYYLDGESDWLKGAG